MPRQVNCRRCRAVITLNEGETGMVRCPGCGASFLRPMAMPDPVAAPEPAPTLAPLPPERPAAEPKRKKKKRKAKRESSMLPIFLGVGAAVFLLVGGVIWAVVGRTKPRPDPADDGGGGVAAVQPGGGPAFQPGGGPAVPPEPEVPKVAWQAKPDPSSTPAFRVSDRLRLPFVGRAFLASGGGPFIADVPGSHELPLRVFDLRTGEYVNRVPRVPLALPPVREFTDSQVFLAPDGKTVLGAASNGLVFSVWKVGEDKRIGNLDVGGSLVLTEFLGDQQFVTINNGIPPRLIFWDLAKAEAIRTIDLPRVPLPGHRPGTMPATAAAVSPGRKFIALITGAYLFVFGAGDGALVGVGTVPAEPAGMGVQSLAFSPDGTELLGTFVEMQTKPFRAGRLRTWKVADGTLAGDVELVELDLSQRLLLGPERDVFFLGPQVIDREQGLWAQEYPTAPLQWRSDGLLGTFPWRAPKFPAVGDPKWQESQIVPKDIGVGFSGDPELFKVNDWWRKLRFRQDTTAVGILPFDRDRFQRNRDAARAAVAPRPPATPGDRGAIVASAPTPPAAWAAVPDPASVPAVPLPLPIKLPSAGHGLFLSGAEAGRAAVLTATYARRPRSRAALTCVWYDVKTGKPLGEPLPLWPWVDGLVEPMKRLALLPELPQLTNGALDIAGTRLALVDAGTPTRVDVWNDSGKRLASLQLPDGSGSVDWVGWSADGRLLTLSGGTLTGWDLPACKAVFETRGDYGIAHLSPNRKWAAVTAKGRVDVVDVGTGKLLGRQAVAAGDGSWLSLAASADGKFLAALQGGGPRRRVLTWDVAKGQALDAFPLPTPGLRTGSSLLWHGPRHLLIDGTELVALDERVVLGLFPPPDGPVASATPDGALWHLTKSATMATRPLPVAGVQLPSVAFGPTTGLAIEVDCGSSTEGVEAALTERLRADGVALAKGGWRLLVRGQPGATSKRLTFGPLDKTGIAVPSIGGSVALVGPNGEQAWKSALTGVWPEKSSKYYSTTRREGTPYYGTVTDFYDFGGKNPQKAMEEEAWENFLQGIRLLALPAGLTKVGDQFQRLPVHLN